MDTVPCPGCSAPLALNQEVCGKCLRPRDQLEIEQGHELVREGFRRRRRRPLVAGAWVLAAAAVFLVFRERARIQELAAPAFAEASREARASFESARAPARAEPRTELGRLAVDALKMDSAAAAAADPKSPPPAENLPIPSLNPEQWALYGRFYDLHTLLPVPNAMATVQFEIGEGNPWWVNVKSDAYGRYVTALKHTQYGGYTVLSNQGDYERSVLCEADVPYAKLTAQERADLVTGVQGGDIPSSSFDAPVDANSMQRDLFLTPRRAAARPQ